MRLSATRIPAQTGCDSASAGADSSGSTAARAAKRLPAQATTDRHEQEGGQDPEEGAALLAQERRHRRDVVLEDPPELLAEVLERLLAREDLPDGPGLDLEELPLPDRIRLVGGAHPPQDADPQASHPVLRGEQPVEPHPHCLPEVPDLPPDDPGALEDRGGRPLGRCPLLGQRPDRIHPLELLLGAVGRSDGLLESGAPPREHRVLPEHLLPEVDEIPVGDRGHRLARQEGAGALDRLPDLVEGGEHLVEGGNRIGPRPDGGERAVGLHRCRHDLGQRDGLRRGRGVALRGGLRVAGPAGRAGPGGRRRGPGRRRGGALPMRGWRAYGASSGPC